MNIAVARSGEMRRTPARRPRRTSGQSRTAILRAATAEFAAHGFAGARVGRIVTKAGTNPRTLYEQFGSKTDLYVATLEAALGALRAEELRLDVAGIDPREALLQLFDFMNTHFERSQHLVRLLTSENLLLARHMKRSGRIREMASPVLVLIEKLLAQGVEQRRIAAGIDPLRLYVMMVALSQFHLSNVHTLSHIFMQDLAASDWRHARAQDARTAISCFLSPAAREGADAGSAAACAPNAAISAVASCE